MTVSPTETGLSIRATSRSDTQACPYCGTFSNRVHSYYERQPRDLPAQGYRVQWCLGVKRFRCQHPACDHTTFAERLPMLVGWHQHCTLRLNQVLEKLAFELGGAAGARSCTQLAMPISGASLLRRIRRSSQPPPVPARVMGVDDWAWRRGVNYGTLLVDLERRQVLEVLPDRESATLTTWLQTQPQVEIMSRDRSTTYREAIDQGAPQAQQVADRWHLFKNLADTLTQSLYPWTPQLQTIRLETEVVSRRPPTPAELSQPTPKRPLGVVVQGRVDRRQRWEQIFQQVHELSQQGLTGTAIARQLGIDRCTVHKYEQLDTLPPRTCTRVGGRLLDPFRAQIRTWWLDHHWSRATILTQLRPLGYTGSASLVYQWLVQLRHDHPEVTSVRPQPVVRPPRRLNAPRLASWILLRPDQRRADQDQVLASAAALSPTIAQLIELGSAFAVALRARQVADFEIWLQRVHQSSLRGLHAFASGLLNDAAAVRAAFTSPHSNGQLEGQITRLKWLKRQMYGRAKFDLLRLRVLRH